ncbi:MAG: hypothetical protein HWE18_09975 [Gammaproteobacteria bacterium]|nr:hypothetical protein [Gammaproteobacteria bacterium]
MKKLLFSLMFLSPSLYACEIPLGKYIAITETEYSLELELKADGLYTFYHKNWLPGGLHHVGEEHIYKGLYVCTANKLILVYTDISEKLIGTYIERSLKDEGFPLEVGETKVLDFTGAPETKSVVTGWYYWPESYVQEASENL